MKTALTVGGIAFTAWIINWLMSAAGFNPPLYCIGYLGIFRPLVHPFASMTLLFLGLVLFVCLALGRFFIGLQVILLMGLIGGMDQFALILLGMGRGCT